MTWTNQLPLWLIALLSIWGVGVALAIASYGFFLLFLKGYLSKDDIVKRTTSGYMFLDAALWPVALFKVFVTSFLFAFYFLFQTKLRRRKRAEYRTPYQAR